MFVEGMNNDEPFIPTPKKTLSEPEKEQVKIIQNFFPEADHIGMYEEESAIQIDFLALPVVCQDTIKNLEDRGFYKISEFHCQCPENCGSYSLILARRF